MTGTTVSDAEIIAAMQAAAPPGLEQLSSVQYGALQELTRELAAARPGAAAEYERFLGTRQRSLPLPRLALHEKLAGKTVLVTGGTGCVGSVLLARLAAYAPGALVSASRGITYCPVPQPGVRYLSCDVTDYHAVAGLTAHVRPDVIFHVSAQRSPALAEIEVHRTVATNVLGTGNVLAVAVAAGVPQVVLASTGKAVRPYSPDVYAASKRAAEWEAAAAAADANLVCSASRFTHVADNSIVHRRLAGWLAAGEPARLHGPEIMFYVQSALESAQLLLLAAVNAAPGEFRVNAITDLGWPVSLLDVALGAMARGGSRSPVYFSGYDPGYEEAPFPGLYDPRTASDVSPLLNAYEAPLAVAGLAADSFPFRTASLVPQEEFDILRKTCGQTREPAAVRQALDDLSWALLADAVAAADPVAVARSAALAGQYGHGMSAEHRRVLEVIENTTAGGAVMTGAGTKLSVARYG